MKQYRARGFYIKTQQESFLTTCWRNSKEEAEEDVQYFGRGYRPDSFFIAERSIGADAPVQQLDAVETQDILLDELRDKLESLREWIGKETHNQEVYIQTLKYAIEWIEEEITREHEDGEVER